MATTKKQMPLRFPADIYEWLPGYAEGLGTSQNEVVQRLLYALKDGRLLELPARLPHPFPANEMKPGGSPEYPVLVCLNLTESE